MRTKRFTGEQIIGVLKEAEAGAKTKELIRKYGISEQTFYHWKAKYGDGMSSRLQVRPKARFISTLPTCLAVWHPPNRSAKFASPYRSRHWMRR